MLWKIWWRRRRNCLATKLSRAEMARNETGGDEIAPPKSCGRNLFRLVTLQYIIQPNANI